MCHTVFVNVKKLRFVDFKMVKSTKNSQIYLKHLSNELYASSIPKYSNLIIYCILLDGLVFEPNMYLQGGNFVPWDEIKVNRM